MFVISLPILSTSIGTILLIIHDRDEIIITRIAFLPGLIAVICAFILTPPLIKSLLGLVLLSIGHKIFSIYQCFK